MYSSLGIDQSPFLGFLSNIKLYFNGPYFDTTKQCFLVAIKAQSLEASLLLVELKFF